MHALSNEGIAALGLGFKISEMNPFWGFDPFSLGLESLSIGILRQAQHMCLCKKIKICITAKIFKI